MAPFFGWGSTASRLEPLEVAQAVEEFKLSSLLRKEETTDYRYHEQTPAFQ